MATAKIHYESALRTICTHEKSGKEIITDAPIDNHGKGEAFSPTDLMATSLTSCMLTTMAIAAKKTGIIFENAEAEIEKIMAQEPRRISEIIIKITMPKYSYTDEQKSILEKAALNCPVAKSLSPELQQQVQFEY